MRTCSRCGKELPESEFYQVKYRGKEPKNLHRICKDCTSIEQRRRYLLKTDPTHPQLTQIERLYAMHEAAGRSVPNTKRRNVDGVIERMLEECE